MKIRYIPNWHHQTTSVTQIGAAVVYGHGYLARWDYTSPTTVCVRSTREALDWAEIEVGGFCEFNDGLNHLPRPETMMAVFAQDTKLFRNPEGENRWLFTADSFAGGQYQYTLEFTDEAILYHLSYQWKGEAGMLACQVMGSPERKSHFRAEGLFHSSPASHGVYYRRPQHKAVSGHASDHWFSPSAFCFPIKLQEGSWASVSAAPRVEQLKFSSFVTAPNASGDLAFRYDYHSQPPVTGTYEAPATVLRWGAASPFEALKNYAEGLVTLGVLPALVRTPAPWWKGTLVCGWHNQESQGGPVRCTQQVYEEHVAKYESVGIDFDVLTIDDFWGQDHGLWKPDPAKWPDLKGFIAAQHQKNRKVLLWVCIRTNGLPENELYRVGDVKLLDPTNSAYRDRLAQALKGMLGSGPDELDADGIKLDFTGAIPPAGTPQSGQRLDGMEYLYRLFEAIHDAAKAAKPDCLLDFQVANPHFAPFYDMSRINDCFLPYEEALGPMSDRAKIAHAVGFGCRVDMDHPSAENYFEQAGRYGNLSLYLTNRQLDNESWVKTIQRATKG